MKQLTQLSLAVAAVALIMGMSAQSQAAGKHTVKVGYAYSDFANDSGQLEGEGVTPGTTASAKNVEALIITYDFNFTKNWSFEMALGVPPTVKLEAQEQGVNLGEVGESKSLAPTFLAIYNYPLRNGWNIYGGLGINYTKLDDVEIYDRYILSALTMVLNDAAIAQSIVDAGYASAEGDIDDSVGLALKLGVTYNFAKNWIVDLSYSYYDVTADITNTVNVNIPNVLQTSQTQKLSLDVDPSLYGISVGYTF